MFLVNNAHRPVRPWRSWSKAILLVVNNADIREVHNAVVNYNLVMGWAVL